MLKIATSVAAILSSVAIATLAARADGAPLTKTTTTDKGPALADARGLTLYTYDKDLKGQSNCNGQCASNWPPLAASASDTAQGDWTLVTRGDGSRQWAYRGKPVYTWIKDSKPGDATGDGAFGTWHLIKM